MSHIDVGKRPARLTFQVNRLSLGNLNHRLRITARKALHEAFDEALQTLRELPRVVRPVHDRASFLFVKSRLRPEIVP